MSRRKRVEPPRRQDRQEIQVGILDAQRAGGDKAYGPYAIRAGLRELFNYPSPTLLLYTVNWADMNLKTR